MLGLVTKNGLVVVRKDLFCGNDGESLKLINAQIASDKTLAYEVHSDSDSDWKTAFENLSITVQPSKDATDWQTAKAQGAVAALTFIAKRLGFE